MNANTLPQLDGRPMVTDWGGGESLAEAITRVDAAASPAYFQVNSLHPVHVAAALANVGGCCGTDARHVEALWN